MLKKFRAPVLTINLVLLGMFSVGTQAAPFVYDGKFVAAEYDKVFAIDYEYDGKIVSGGVLGLATDGDKQYLYISHPLGFKDFSYGSDSDEKYRVGWDGQDDGNIDLGKAVDSEYFEFSLTTGTTTHELKFDLKKPSADSKINGTAVDAGETVSVGSGTGETDVGFISTLDYNAKQISNSFDGSLGAFDSDHSPETLTPAEIAGCADETSSDPSCYQLKDTAENKVAGNLIDWVFEFGIEIELDLVGSTDLFFGDLASLVLSNFGYQTGSAIISLDGLHASDPKTISDDKHDPDPCLDGSQSPDHEPCSAIVIPPPSVPEPGTLVLMSLGLLGLGFSRRKKS